MSTPTKIVVQDSISAESAAVAPVPAPFPPPELKGAVAVAPEGKKEKKSRPSEVHVTDVVVIIGMKTKGGKREEVQHSIDVEDGLRIVKCVQEIEERQRQCKEDGQLIGFEPTGEYNFNLKVKYVKD